MGLKYKGDGLFGGRAEGEALITSDGIAFNLGVDEATGKRTLCAMSAIDNLIKGGAGQAVQSFNLMTGRDETYGLDLPGLWP